MYGWRARVGLIVPSSNTTMEPEMRRLMPRGVSVHTARVRLSNVNVEELLLMEKDIRRATELLATADVDIIVYGCTTGSLVGGLDYDKKLINLIRSISKKPTLTTATAVVKALKTIGAKRIGLVTPYIDEVNEKEVKFLEGHGFEIIDLQTFNIEKNVEIGKVYPEKVYRLVKNLRLDKADAIFISCTNLRTIDIINFVEKDLGLPTISSNTATAWLTLKELGIKEAGYKAGRLLTEYL